MHSLQNIYQENEKIATDWKKMYSKDTLHKLVFSRKIYLNAPNSTHPSIWRTSAGQQESKWDLPPTEGPRLACESVGDHFPTPSGSSTSDGQAEPWKTLPHWDLRRPVKMGEPSPHPLTLGKPARAHVRPPHPENLKRSHESERELFLYPEDPGRLGRARVSSPPTLEETSGLERPPVTQ